MSLKRACAIAGVAESRLGVVPDSTVMTLQAEAMVAALAKQEITHAYVPFEGEQHGFRRAENICTALDGELYFYSRVFGLDLPDPIEPVRIENDRFLPIR